MTVSPGQQDLFFARARDAAYAVAPVFLKEAGAVDITEFVTNVSWGASDKENFTSLSVSLDNYRGVFNMIPHGTKIRLQIRLPFQNFESTKKGKFYDYCTAFVFTKNRSGSADSQTMELTCFDRLYWLAQNDLTKKVYKSDSKKPNGWTASQIIRDIALQLKVPIGKIDPTTKAIKRFETKGKALDEIKRALNEDKKLTGRKKSYVIHMRDGKLNVVLENTNPKSAYLFNDVNSIETGTLSEDLGEDFATRLVVKGNTSGRAKTAGGTSVRKVSPLSLTVNPENNSYQQAFGIIQKERKLKGSPSSAEFRRVAKNLMAEAIRPRRTFEITTRGVPHVWPGSQVFINSGYFGINGLVKVTGVQYALSGGEFTLQMTLVADKKVFTTQTQADLYYKRLDVRY